MKIYKQNPNGSHEEQNDLVEYDVMYSKNGKYYFLCVTQCTKNECGGISMWCDFSDHYATMKRVNRQSKKAEELCNSWLKENIDDLHNAYIAGGMNAVKVLATLPAELNV